MQVRKTDDIIFQHDESSPHWTSEVTELSNYTFPNRWIWTLWILQMARLNSSIFNVWLSLMELLFSTDDLWSKRFTSRYPGIENKNIWAPGQVSNLEQHWSLECVSWDFIYSGLVMTLAFWSLIGRTCKGRSDSETSSGMGFSKTSSKLGLTDISRSSGGLVAGIDESVELVLLDLRL